MPVQRKVVLESAVERKVVAYAKKHSVMVTKMTMAGYSSMPDRCFWLPGGKPLMIEFKRPGGRPTTLQEFTINQLRLLGYEVHIIDNAEEGISLLRSRGIQ